MIDKKAFFSSLGEALRFELYPMFVEWQKKFDHPHDITLTGPEEELLDNNQRYSVIKMLRSRIYFMSITEAVDVVNHHIEYKRRQELK
jgi:hypothetical protein